jgi:hypothetical protein
MKKRVVKQCCREAEVLNGVEINSLPYYILGTSKVGRRRPEQKSFKRPLINKPELSLAAAGLHASQDTRSHCRIW